MNLINISRKFYWQFAYTSDDIKVFANLSGDRNPIHTDDKFAKCKGFKGAIIYGALYTSQVSRLIGEELPDKNYILTSVNINFQNPGYVNEVLTFNAEVIFVSEATKSIEIKFNIRNSDLVICRGRCTALWKP